MREVDLQTACNVYLDDNGFLWYHREKGRNNKQKAHSAGLPDLLIWRDEKGIFVELKTKTGKQSEVQKKWQRKPELSVRYYPSRK